MAEGNGNDVAVKETWITQDEDLLVLFRGKKKEQVLLHADAIEVLLQEVARDPDDNENDYPGTPVVDAEVLDDMLRPTEDDARSEIETLFSKHGIDPKKSEDLVEDLVAEFSDAEPDEEPETDDEGADPADDPEDEPEGDD